MNCEKVDTLDYLIAMATLDADISDVNLFENLDTSGVVLSDNLDFRITKLIKRSQASQAKPRSRAMMALSKAAIIALIILSIAFTTMMSISAIRNAVWNVIVDWYDKYLSVDYEPEYPSTVPSEIEEVRKPTLLPPDAEEELIGKNNNMYLAEYYLGDECILVFSQSLLPGGQMQIDSESAIIREVKIGEFTGNMLTYDKDNMIIIFWNDGRYGYDLTGYGLDAETLIMVAQSVR